MTSRPAIFQQAVNAAQKAVDLDNATEYEQAFTHYRDALKLFIHISKYEKNPKQKRTLDEKIREYLERAEKLKAHLDEQDKIKKEKSSTTGANGQASGGRKEDGDFDAEAKRHRAMLSETILTEKPNIRWEDVAGLETAKEALQEAVMMPKQFPELFTDERKPWKGILLFGPPGTGKSFLAKAIATEADSTFFSISSSDIVSKWMGDSEKLVKELFKLAREKQPSIIFIDEVDALATKRGGDNESEAARRIKTEFLRQMDGVGGDTTGIVILGATNLPWELDTAMMRRLDRTVHIGLPDASARMRLFRLNIGRMPCDLKPDDFKTLAELSEGFSGSDITIAVRDALMQPVRMIQRATHYKKVVVNGKEKFTPCSPGDRDAIEMTWSAIRSNELQEPILHLEDFVRAVKGTPRTVSEKDVKEYTKWETKRLKEMA